MRDSEEDYASNLNADVAPEKLEYIQDFIANKQYEEGLKAAIEFLYDSITERNEINISFCLEIVKAICDKSEETINLSLQIVPKLINHDEYWIRQIILEIIKKIYLFKPEIISPYIEKIESKLFDQDKNVRMAAIKIISLILNHSMDQYKHLYVTYSRMFEDHAWTVRAMALEASLKFLSPESNPTPEMLDAFTENIFQLFRDPDEEVKGLAAEFFKALCYHIEPEKIIKIITPILTDVDWEIREKGVWIVGEIGDLYFQDFIPLFELLIDLFEDENLMIQTKTIDAFVKIGKNYGAELLKLLLSHLDGEGEEINQGISETLIFITLNNTKPMIRNIIKELDTTDNHIRETIKEILIKVYMESPELIESEVYRLFQQLDNSNWRQRHRIARLLGDLNYILKIETIAVWTVINLRSWKEKEKDFDVIEEIENSLQKIYNIFENIEEEIERLNSNRDTFYKKLLDLKEEPKVLRGRVGKFIQEKNFNDAEIALEEETREIMKKIDTLENELNESEFKRCSIEVFQDFKDAKDEIYEHISDVKNIMFTRIYDERSSYLEELRGVKQNLQKRIDVLEAEYKSVKEMEKKFDESIEHSIEEDREDEINEFIDSLSNVRRKIYKLEFEIGQTWIKNLDFKDFLKSLTIYWIDTKLEIQKYLADVFYKFRKLQTEEDGESPAKAKIKNRITFEFLNQQFQNTVVQAIQSQEQYLKEFSTIQTSIEDHIKNETSRKQNHG